MMSYEMHYTRYPNSANADDRGCDLLRGCDGENCFGAMLTRPSAEPSKLLVLAVGSSLEPMGIGSGLSFKRDKLLEKTSGLN